MSRKFFAVHMVVQYFYHDFLANTVCLVALLVLCPDIPVLAHADPVSVDLRPGSTVTYECHGFLLFPDGSRNKTITCKYYQWWPVLQDCIGTQNYCELSISSVMLHVLRLRSSF
jgi:hypothetical protein